MMLAALACYLGLFGGFIIKKFAKEELEKVKNKSWLIEKSEFVYAVLAFIFYFASKTSFFDSAASAVFIYGVAVGALRSEKHHQILLKNIAFLIIVLALFAFNF